MASVASSLEFRLSGGNANADPNAAIGGAESAIEVVNASGENLFSDVSVYDAANGSKKYRCIYLYNKTDKKLSALGVYIGSKAQSPNTQVFVGLGTSVVGASGSEQTISNEDTPPVGVIFARPISASTALSLPDIPVGYYLPLWIMRETTVGAEGVFDDYVVIMVDGRDDVDLDMPLHSSLELVTGIGAASFTRGSTAKWFDDDEVMRTAAVDEPRFENSMLLMEKGGENFAIYSERIDTWSANAVSVTVDSILAPDLSSADKVVEDAGTSYHFIKHNATYSPAELTVTGSVFIYKYSTKTSASLLLFNATDTYFAQVDFDIVNGVAALVSGDHVIVESRGNWWRVGLTGTATTNFQNGLRVFLGGYASYAGDGISWLGLWGGMMEGGPEMTSYIPTQGTTATRSGDNCTVDFAGNHPSLQPGNAFTYEFDMMAREVDAPERTVFNAGFNEGGIDRFSIARVADYSDQFVYYRSNAAVNFTDESIGTKSRYKITVDEFQSVSLYIDDVLSAGPVTRNLASDTGVDPAKIGIGCRATGGVQLNGHISNIKIYNRVV